MGAINPNDREFLKRFVRAEDDIRRLKMRPSGKGGGGPITDTKTFLVGGEVFVGRYVPEMMIQLDPNGDAPCTKHIADFGFFARINTGISVRWIKNGASWFPTLGELMNENDKVRPSFIAGSGQDLSAFITFTITPIVL